MSKLTDMILNLLPSSIERRLGLAILRRLAQERTTQWAIGDISHLEHTEVLLQDTIRKLSSPVGPIKGYEQPAGLPTLDYAVQPTDPPWKQSKHERLAIPGMLTDEEMQYYYWIAKYYRGEAEVVELGPWLGLSTAHLALALAPQLSSAGRQIHVFDDFVWRSDWMDKHLENGHPPPTQHSSFMPMFEGYVARFREHLLVTRGKFTNYDGNEDLPMIAWCGKPIEMIVVDCGRTVVANQSWLDIFSPCFIPNRTLVVMQDWRLHRERPRQYFNQTLMFTMLNPRLELVHEIENGGIATFLYR